MSIENIRIAIKTVNNDLYNLTVDSGIRIEDLKERVQEATTVSASRQRLIYRGRVLLDENTVRDYNIEDGHTVHMVARPVNFQPNSTAATAHASNRVINAQTPNTAPAQQNRILSSTGATLAIGAADETNTMEHIRQNMLTMHTLLSTISTQDLTATPPHGNYSSFSSSPSRHRGEHAHGDPINHSLSFSHSQRLDQSVTTEGNAAGTERRFFVGQWVDVKDTVNQWLEATIMNTNEAERKMFIHYNGW